MGEMVPIKVQVEKLEAQLIERLPTFEEMLPSGTDVVRFKRNVLQAVSADPKLLECTRASLFGAFVETATLGLKIGASQQAAIVPFRDNRSGTMVATFMPMYQGLLDLVYRSGDVSWVKVEVVYAGDVFDYREEGDRTILQHIPSEADDPGELRAVWMKTKIKGESDPLLTVMWRRDVLKHRDRSRAASRRDSPWNTDEPAMWKKTIIRVTSKLLPKSDERLSRAVAFDEMADRGEAQPFDFPADGGGAEPLEDDAPSRDERLLGEKECEPTRKHLFAFAGEWVQDGEDNHAVLHEIIEPMGYASVNDVPMWQVDGIKEAIRGRVEDAEVGS